MNNKHLIFFGDKGLTSTSANHIANLAKEEYQKYEAVIQGIRLYSTSAELIGTNTSTKIYQESGRSTLQDVPDMLNHIAELNSLIAWLREAISAKSILSNAIKNTSLQDYCIKFNIPYPQRSGDIKFILTEDDYYGSLNVAQRNEYYTLESIASTIGKYIHPDGPLSKIRKKYHDNVIANPSSVTGTGSDIVIYNNTSTISVGEIESVFFSLQKKQREAQAQLNSYKFNCEKAIADDTLRYNKEWKEDTLRYNQEMDKVTQEYNNWMTTEISLINNYKIIIPNNIKEIFDKINKLGK